MVSRLLIGPWNQGSQVQALLCQNVLNVFEEAFIAYQKSTSALQLILVYQSVLGLEMLELLEQKTCT